MSDKMYADGGMVDKEGVVLPAIGSCCTPGVGAGYPLTPEQAKELEQAVTQNSGDVNVTIKSVHVMTNDDRYAAKYKQTIKLINGAMLRKRNNQ